MWNHIINIYSSESLRTKTKESRINEHNFFLKWTVGTNCIRYSNHAGRGQAQYLISYVQAV